MLALLGLAGALAFDLTRPPADQLIARTLVKAIAVYQSALSPGLNLVGVRCRFSPTCSVYGRTCVQRFGAARGTWLALRRILRCGPWTTPGTEDPVPVPRRAVPAGSE